MRPSTPPEVSRRSSPPPAEPNGAPLGLVDSDDDRISVDPGSRRPWLPSVPPPTDDVAPSIKATDGVLSEASVRGAPGTSSDAAAAPKAGAGTVRGPNHTVRMMADKARPSIDIGRKSRISVLRETIFSRLPSIPFSRIAASGPLSTLALVFFAAIAVVVWMWSTGRVPAGLATVLHLHPTTQEALVPPALPTVDTSVDENPFPTLRRGRAPMSGGVLFIPTSFTARADGSYDLIVHFHGNTELTIESYESAQLDAIVAVFNLGTGSGKYEDRFSNPAALGEVLARTTEALKERGLPNPQLKRVALVAWSAGYGAVIRILDHPADADRVDAVLLLDGLHTSYKEGTHEIEEANLVGVERFAERAKKGERLFLVTHSDIEPIGYLGVHATVDFVLSRIGMQRHPVTGTTSLPHLVSMEGVLPKDELKALVPTSEAREGGVIIRGYGGNESATHIAHLVQMSQLALPSLQARWQL